MKHRIAITTTLVALISCLLTSIGQPAKAQDWKALWEQEHARCFANGFDSTAYANSNIVPVLEKAAEEGDADAELDLLYWKLWSDSHDSNAIFMEMRWLSDERDVPWASMSIGLSYLTGILTVCATTDHGWYGVYDESYRFTERTKGIPYLQKAAEGGIYDAVNYLYRIYRGLDIEDFDGKGLVEPDFDKAYYYAKLGAEQGNAVMQAILAFTFYASRDGFPATYVDNAKYEYWMRKSAENGFPLAQYVMGADADTPEKSFYWLKKAANGGYEDAIVMVAEKYNDDDKYESCIKAISWCNEYLEKYPDLFALKKQKYIALRKMGSDSALSYLDELAGNIFASPESIDASDIRFVGVQYFSIAEDVQNKRRQYELQSKGVQVLTISADKGDADSMYWLGLAYGLGKGGRENQKKSHSYYLAAARNGHEKAQEFCEKHNLY